MSMDFVNNYGKNDYTKKLSIISLNIKPHIGTLGFRAYRWSQKRDFMRYLKKTTVL